MFDNKVLLITGGTGSFGTAALRRFLRTGAAEIRVFSRDEKKQDDMRREYGGDRVKFYIGDVRDPRSLCGAMYGVDFLFHAAALKQVPSCEFFPMEAVRTNIEGTDNVLGCAVEAGVKKVVCLSTDKAVYPVNAMGLSKAMMEKVLIARAGTVDAEKTLICGTRYGNVMASRGSVIPTFTEQIISGRPVTITNPHMTRFMMSLDDAIDLVVFAFENARAGDIMVRKSPACTIGDLARALVEIFGAGGEIVPIGIRRGEKMHEALLSKEEGVAAEDMSEYYRIPADSRSLNYEKYFSGGDADFSEVSKYTSENTRRLTYEELKDMLLGLDYIKEQLKLFRPSKE